LTGTTGDRVECAAAFLCGIMVLLAASRPAAMAGGLVALLGGVWFVVGAPILADYGLGVVIVIFAAFALGRFVITAVPAGRHALPQDETEPFYPQERYPAGS
jgi:hypothetical protein